jgi:hypothetical protein
MLFEALSFSDQAYGLMNLIAIIINFILSLIIMKKAVQKKANILYIFFLAVFFTGVAWWPVGIKYLYWIFTNELLTYGFLSEVQMLALAISFISWLYIYMKIIHRNKPKMLLLILISFTLFTAIIFGIELYYLRFAPNAPVKNITGKEITPFITESGDVILIWAIIAIITMLITGIHFSVDSIRVDNLEIQWKGKFLLISFMLYVFGEMDFLSMFLGVEFAVLTKLILIIANFLFYIGFIMPDFMKRILSLEKG